MSRGMLIIISGPSGSGKGTVVRQLREIPGYAISVSMTTREKRGGEVDGKDYFFRTREEFINMRGRDELLEHATFCDNLYGTPRFYVEQEIEKGNSVILEIEVNGALQVREKFPDSVLIFLIPPTLIELKKRLVKRAREDAEEIERRFRQAHEELKLVPDYDYLVINDSIGDAIRDIETIVCSEKMRPRRSEEKIEKFKGGLSNC